MTVDRAASGNPRGAGPEALATSLIATVGDGRVGVIATLDSARPGSRVAGPALTVQAAPGDNLAIHHGISAARGGEILVVDVGGEQSVAHFGGVLATAAEARGLAGVVLNGAIRDFDDLGVSPVAVFYSGRTPRPPRREAHGAVGAVVSICGVSVHPGDLLFADDDGIVVVPLGLADELVSAALALETHERQACARLREGELTYDILGIPRRRELHGP